MSVPSCFEGLLSTNTTLKLNPVYPICAKTTFLQNNTNSSDSGSIRIQIPLTIPETDSPDLIKISTYDAAIMSFVLQVALHPEFQKWTFSVLGCLCVGVAGAVPFFIFRPGANAKSTTRQKSNAEINQGIEPKLLNCLLSFAVGSLLGDAFLHLLPEAWERSRADEASLMLLGIWILIGIISFVICEKLVNFDPEITVVVNNNVSNAKGPSQSEMTTGYLNLVANIFDNFTHGLAVAGSFIVSPKVGFLTTAAILLHEVPHEIADFAILLRSGFDPWSAAKAQLSTASVGLLGALLALTADSVETEIGGYTWWILPFTAGCFITIALNNLLPDLMKEKNAKESLKQGACLLLGISVMGIVSAYHI